MTTWSSHEYGRRPALASRDYRCDQCQGLIFKGEEYERTYGGQGKEHIDNCPTDPAERARRGCRSIGDEHGKG